jgi:hypothetical protein
LFASQDGSEDHARRCQTGEHEEEEPSRVVGSIMQANRGVIVHEQEAIGRADL